MADTLTIDGFGPVPVLTPATVAEACAIVKQQQAAKQAVYPVGGGTQLDFGLVPNKPGVAVSTKALNKVIDYPARDMTITVQAGITLAELQAVLATEGQWLPLDAPQPERVTLGGLVATNTAGPRRLGYGTLRDFVIGIEFINDNGDAVHGGGRVVKNVAGYDLMKLNIGALGAFGLITQLTLKVRPKPEAKTVWQMGIDSVDMEKVIHQLHRSASRPVAAHLLVSEARILTIGFEERAATVEWQVRAFVDEMKSLDVDHAPFAVDDVVADTQWQELSEAALDSQWRYVTKVSAKSSEMASRLPHLADMLADGIILSDVTNGISHHCRSDSPLSDTGAQGVMLRAPAAWKTPERVFGPPTPAFELMRHIKRTLDPDDVFNPGRMFVFEQNLAT